MLSKHCSTQQRTRMDPAAKIRVRNKKARIAVKNIRAAHQSDVDRWSKIHSDHYPVGQSSLSHLKSRLAPRRHIRHRSISNRWSYIRTCATFGVTDDLRTLGVDIAEFYALASSIGGCGAAIGVAVEWVWTGAQVVLINDYPSCGGSGITSKCSECDERFAEHVSCGLLVWGGCFKEDRRLTRVVFISFLCHLSMSTNLLDLYKKSDFQRLPSQ